MYRKPDMTRRAANRRHNLKLRIKAIADMAARGKFVNSSRELAQKVLEEAMKPVPLPLTLPKRFRRLSWERDDLAELATYLGVSLENHGMHWFWSDVLHQIADKLQICEKREARIFNTIWEIATEPD